MSDEPSTCEEGGKQQKQNAKGEKNMKTVPVRFPLYGYDPSATLNDAATLNDTTRNDATHDDLAPRRRRHTQR